MSGINTVGVGQVEAARSLGMSFNRILAKIVIPQALRSSVLPMTNLFIAVMLTTALGSQVPRKPQELTGVVSYHHALARRRRRVLYLGARLPGHGLCGKPHWQLYR